LQSKNAYKVIDPTEGTETYALDFQLTAGRTLSGTIVDPDGRPLAGCSAAGLVAMSSQPQLLKDAAFTVTALDPAEVRTVAFLHHERKLAGALKIGATEPTIAVVKLQPCGSVSGRLLDREGKPVAGARVVLGYQNQAVGGLIPSRGGPTLETGPDGRFRIDTIVPGEEFDIRFPQRGMPPSAAGAVRRLTMAPGEVRDVGDIRPTPQD
jgi:hypothetical protein